MAEWLGYVLLAVGTMMVLGIVLLVNHRKNNPKVEKRQGRESRAEQAVGPARQFARSNSFRLLAPARLVRGDKTADLDAVVIGYFGVLGVKALGYNGEIYGSPDEDTWVQVSEDGGRTRFDNPITEAAADVRVIRDALFGAKLKQVPVEVVCVFTNPKAQIALPRGTGHYTLKEYKTLLRKDKYLEDTGLDLDKVEQALTGALQPGS